MLLSDYISTTQLIEAGYIVLVTLVAAVIGQRVLRYISESKKGSAWLQVLASASIAPYRLLVWVYGLMTTFTAFFHHEELQIFRVRVLQGRSVVVVAIVSWLLFRFKRRVEKEILQKVLSQTTNRSHKALIAAANRLMSIVFVTFTALMILRILDVPLAGLLAVGGVGSLAISFASKDVVANFFGGLMLYVNHPFSEGDWIRSPNKGFEGTVEQIGWYMTRIRTKARVPTFIPNALLTDAIVENPGQMYNRQIKTTIGVRYDDYQVTKAILHDVREMIHSHPGVDHDQLILVHLVEYGAYSINFDVICFTLATKALPFRDTQEDILFKIADIIEERGAEIAFPTQTLHLTSTDQQSSPSSTHSES